MTSKIVSLHTRPSSAMEFSTSILISNSRSQRQRLSSLRDSSSLQRCLKSKSRLQKTSTRSSFLKLQMKSAKPVQRETLKRMLNILPQKKSSTISPSRSQGSRKRLHVQSSSILRQRHLHLFPLAPPSHFTTSLRTRTRQCQYSDRGSLILKKESSPTFHRSAMRFLTRRSAKNATSPSTSIRTATR